MGTNGRHGDEAVMEKQASMKTAIDLAKAQAGSCQLSQLQRHPQRPSAAGLVSQSPVILTTSTTNDRRIPNRRGNGKRDGLMPM